MNSKTSALLAILIIIILIVIIAVWYSYNCEPEKCEKRCEKTCNSSYVKKNCRGVYSPESDCASQVDKCNSKSSSTCKSDNDDLLADPWEKHNATLKEYGYSK